MLLPKAPLPLQHPRTAAPAALSEAHAPRTYGHDEMITQPLIVGALANDDRHTETKPKKLSTCLDVMARV